MSESKLTVIGDSCAEGRGGVIGPDGRFVGFAVYLAKALGLSGEIVNLGSFGATTQDVVDRQLAVALRRPAPLMGVIIGGNDLVTNYNRDQFQRNLRQIYTSLVEPGRLVFTTNWPNIPDRLAGVPEEYRRVMRERFAEANVFLDGLVHELGIVCLDMVNATISTDAAMWSLDGMHPSPAGHQAIGAALADLVDEVSLRV